MGYKIKYAYIYYNYLKYLKIIKKIQCLKYNISLFPMLYTYIYICFTYFNMYVRKAYFVRVRTKETTHLYQQS